MILFLFFPLLVSADLYYLAPQLLNPAEPLLIRRIAMYSPEDAPSHSAPGNGESFIKIQLQLSSPDDSPKDGKVEAIIIEGNTLDMIVGCDNEGLLDTTEEVYRIKGEFHHSTSAKLEGRFSVTKTGNHWLILSNCDSRLGEIQFSGVTEWMNPYGHLPGRLYPFLPFYEYMSILFIVVGLIWFSINAYYWKEVVQLQNYITFVLALCMLEMTAWFFDYRNFNHTGIRHVGVVVVGMLISVFRRSVSRMLVVAVSLGYGVVRPTLGSDGWTLLGLGLVYLIFESALELAMRYGQTNEIGVWRVVLSLPPAALNAIFYWWIFLALAKLTEQLRARKQEEKLALYIQFTRVLGLSLVAAVGFALYQMYYMSSGLDVTEWKKIWLFESGIPEMLYTVILLTILVLWRPSNNNKRFAYAQISGNEKGDEEMEVFNRENATPIDPETAAPAADSSATKPRFTIADGEDGDEDHEEGQRANSNGLAGILTNAISSSDEPLPLQKLD